MLRRNEQAFVKLTIMIQLAFKKNLNLNYSRFIINIKILWKVLKDRNEKQ